MEDFNPWCWQFDSEDDTRAALLKASGDKKLTQIIIGLRGYKKSGKDTVAAFAEKCERLAFADKLKETAKSIFDLTNDQLNNQDLKEQVDASWGLTPRFILQRLGGDIARSIHGDVWIRVIQRHIEQNSGLWPSRFELDVPAFIITDLRYINEAEAIKAWGGYLVELRRPGTGGDNHPSETELDGYPFDYTIDNDGTKEDLKRKVDDLLMAIRQCHEKKWLG